MQTGNFYSNFDGLLLRHEARSVLSTVIANVAKRSVAICSPSTTLFVLPIGLFKLLTIPLPWGVPKAGWFKFQASVRDCSGNPFAVILSVAEGAQKLETESPTLCVSLGARPNSVGGHSVDSFS